MTKKTKQRERIDNPEEISENSIIHKSKYLWACKEVKGRKVLDIASGIGYGSSLLAKEGKAKYVIGVDYFKEAIKTAKKLYENDKVKFLQGDATKKLPFEDAEFDVVTSFETIEHLNCTEVYLSEIQRVLKPGGLMFLSTPNKKFFSPIWKKSYNAYHIKEWGVEELGKHIKKYFEDVEIFGQIEVKNPYRRVIKAIIQNRMITPALDKIDSDRSTRFYKLLKKYVFDKIYPPLKNPTPQILSEWQKKNIVIKVSKKKQYLFTLVRALKK